MKWHRGLQVQLKLADLLLTTKVNATHGGLRGWSSPDKRVGLRPQMSRGSGGRSGGRPERPRPTERRPIAVAMVTPPRPLGFLLAAAAAAINCWGILPVLLVQFKFHMEWMTKTLVCSQEGKALLTPQWVRRDAC